MEGSDLDLLKDIPGFKAIVRAVLKSQMKQLVEHLSEHGGEEALLFTTSVSDGTFHYIGSTAAKGFLDGRQDIKSQFIGHCMKGGQDTEVPNVHAEGVVQASSDKSPPFIVSKTSPNVVTYTSRRSSRAVTLPLRYMSSDNSPVKQKGVGETTEIETDNLQTSRSKAGSKVSSPKGRGKKSRKRPSATVTSETPVKRSAIEGTIRKTLDALSTGQEQAVGDSIKIENNFSDPDNAEIDDSNSSGTLSLDHGREPSLDTSTNIKDGPNNDHEPNVLEHSGPDFQIKIEPADNDSGDNEDHTDDIDVGVNPGQDTTTGTGPSAEANTNPKIRQCPLCDYSTTRISNYKRHMESHTGKSRMETFTCEECDRTFTTRFGLKIHRKTVHVLDGAEEPVQCEHCPYSTRHNSNFKRHMATHSGDPKPVLSLICDYCGLEFKSRYGLKSHRDRHLASKESGISPKRRSGEGLTQCPVCSYTTVRPSNLKRHMTTHGIGSKPDVTYVCDQCGSNFKSKYGLKIHTDSFHNAKFKYRCHACDKGYNTLWNFEGHLKSHEPENVHLSCDVCGTKFRFMSSLIRHKRQGHNNRKKHGGQCTKEQQAHVCDQCGLAFSCSTSLKDHKKALHDGETLECDWCEKKFKWRSSLFYHKKLCKVGAAWEDNVEILKDELAMADSENENDEIAIAELESDIADYSMADS